MRISLPAAHVPLGILPLGSARLSCKSAYKGRNVIVDNEAKKRADRLKEVMHTKYNGKQVNLANALGIQADYLSRLFSGKKKLSGDKAREYETILQIPKYSLDEDIDNVEIGPDLKGKVPLISWVIAGEFCESPDNFQPGDAEDWLACPKPHSARAYCLKVKGDSMDNGEDGYRNGEIIFVDPEVAAVPGKDVVVRTPEGQTTFKRLKEDEEGLYLLGLNGKKIMRVPEGTCFCGVVIFSGFAR
jgi:SOS-response transcriptional repressor LexA